MIAQVVAVTGATGGIGGCAVLLALAVGASKASLGLLQRDISSLQKVCLRTK